MAITRKVDTDVYCDICGKWVMGWTSNNDGVSRAWAAKYARKKGCTVGKKIICKECRIEKRIQTCSIEVYEYHTAKYGAPGQERQEKKKATPEQMAKRNRYNRERLARWKIRNNFDVDDYFTRLSYEKDKRPESMEEAKEDWKAFLQILRREYKKRGAELKWMRNIEVGTRGAWHIHIIVNRIPDTDVILAKAWKHGQIQNQLLYQKGEFPLACKNICDTV